MWLSRTTPLNVPFHAGAVEVFVLGGGHGDASQRVFERVWPGRGNEPRDRPAVFRDLDLLPRRDLVEEREDLGLRLRSGHFNGHMTTIPVLWNHALPALSRARR